VAALEATLALRELAEDRVSVELLAPEPHFWYRPLAVVEPFGLGDVHGIELTELAHACGAGFTLGALAAVDAVNRVARTRAGAEFDYDALLIATGATPIDEPIPGASTFRGFADGDRVGRLLEEAASGSLRHIVFAVPGGVRWSLPLYELALLTAAHLAGRGIDDVEIALVTPEPEPLALFGSEASAAVEGLLTERGVSVHTGRYPFFVKDGVLTLAPRGSVRADRVVTLPRLVCAPIDGVPCDRDGFVPTDPSGRVIGLHDVYAAGDVTTFPVKQGGLAAQQARAAAETIAAEAGADIGPEPFRPILRGLVLTGSVPHYLRAELAGGSGDSSVASAEPLWWPAAKIVGRHFAPLLADRADVVLTQPARADALPPDVELDAG
jgi:sulfide:quinone oxidoreductase